MGVVTEIPDELRFRGIAPAEPAHGFRISLDMAEPWGGGHIEGRVERRGERQDRRPISVRVRCLAAWIDVAPQLVGGGSQVLGGAIKDRFGVAADFPFGAALASLTLVTLVVFLTITRRTGALENM